MGFLFPRHLLRRRNLPALNLRQRRRIHLNRLSPRATPDRYPDARSVASRAAPRLPAGSPGEKRRKVIFTDDRAGHLADIGCSRTLAASYGRDQARKR